MPHDTHKRKPFLALLGRIHGPKSLSTQASLKVLDPPMQRWMMRSNAHLLRIASSAVATGRDNLETRVSDSVGNLARHGRA